MASSSRSFSAFTNLYSLSKTLRFELKPVKNTMEMLETNKVFEKDKLIKDKYERTKTFIDKLHREFIEDSLCDAKLSNIDRYMLVLSEFRRDPKNKTRRDKLLKEEKRLRQEVISLFNQKASEWAKEYKDLGLKKENIDMLFSEDVFNILKTRYEHEDGTTILDEVTGKQISIFGSWKGFTGYFSKFQETRKNLYKDDGTSTAIATRVVDQNLKRFSDNVDIYKEQILKHDIDLTEVEENFGKPIGDILCAEFYNHCLLQKGIDTYNSILGGVTQEDGKKIKGVNEVINHYRQQNKGTKIPFLKPLDKQILSQKEKFIDEIEDDEAFKIILKDFTIVTDEKVTILRKLIEDFVVNNDYYDLDTTYISKQALNTILFRWTLNLHVIEEQLFSVYKDENDKTAKYDRKEDSYKFPDFILFSYLKKALNNCNEDKIWKDKYDTVISECNDGWVQFLNILNYEFTNLFKFQTHGTDGNDLLIGFDIFHKNLLNLVNDKNYEINQKSKVTIKNYADNVLTIYQMGKYFALEKKRKWVNEYEISDFYTNPEYGYLKFYEDAYEDIIQVYNKIRNYLTKKPYSEEKWKLNFENSTLANGWDKNKERDNTTIVLRKDGKYFLGIMSKGNNDIFSDRYKDDYSTTSKEGVYHKMVYKFFPDQAKMFPKVCFSQKGLEYFKPSEEIVRIYKNAAYKKGDNFKLLKMQKLIDFYKECLKMYEGWKLYDFHHIKLTSEYSNNIGEFYRDVAEDGYLISYEDISAEYIEKMNNAEKLYLFQIRNKDWNKEAKGKKNLHTLYFEALFSEDNRRYNFPIKLDGQAELFFRPKTNVDKLGSKVLKNGKTVINHKRYSEDKMFFHVPITINRTEGSIFNFNSHVNEFLSNNPDINIIGVDRGEKHLAYYSVINQDGKRLKSDTLNVVHGVDYAEKLSAVADNRERARKDWQDIQTIKDLKKGYISQVVRTLVDLAIKYNAIIVFEDLNMRFKQIRGGIEKSAYQQLEKALIEKLNYLVNKEEIDIEEAGSVYKAYQLTAPFETFQRMGKQTGIMFYTQASYTSKIDPLTGWRPNLYLSYSSAKKAKSDILKFLKIIYNSNEKRFEFTYDLKSFISSSEYPEKTKWTVCSCVERYRWDRRLNNNKGDYVHYANLTQEFLELLDKYKIDLSKDIIEQISTLETKGNEGFFKSFVYLFRLICQIRNTNPNEEGDENDYIQSPVKPFFDSRKNKEENLPTNGDDNGAYNIARKGIIILNKISRFANEHGGSCEKLRWGDLYVSNREWDNFTQNNY